QEQSKRSDHERRARTRQAHRVPLQTRYRTTRTMTHPTQPVRAANHATTSASTPQGLPELRRATLAQGAPTHRPAHAARSRVTLSAARRCAGRTVSFVLSVASERRAE